MFYRHRSVLVSKTNFTGKLSSSARYPYPAGFQPSKIVASILAEQATKPKKFYDKVLTSIIGTNKGVCIASIIPNNQLNAESSQHCFRNIKEKLEPPEREYTATSETSDGQVKKAIQNTNAKPLRTIRSPAMSTTASLGNRCPFRTESSLIRKPPMNEADSHTNTDSEGSTPSPPNLVPATMSNKLHGINNEKDHTPSKYQLEDSAVIQGHSLTSPNSRNRRVEQRGKSRNRSGSRHRSLQRKDRPNERPESRYKRDRQDERSSHLEKTEFNSKEKKRHSPRTNRSSESKRDRCKERDRHHAKTHVSRHHNDFHRNKSPKACQKPRQDRDETKELCKGRKCHNAPMENDQLNSYVKRNCSKCECYTGRSNPDRKRNYAYAYVEESREAEKKRKLTSTFGVLDKSPCRWSLSHNKTRNLEQRGKLYLFKTNSMFQFFCCFLSVLNK